MKINVEVDITPEELRRFFGLPDVQGLQQQWLDGVAETLQSSGEQQQEVMRNLIMGSFAPFAPFQSFFGSRPNTTDEK